MGRHKAIVGLSGGIDSTVIVHLCVNALGKDAVMGLLMHYGEQSITDSQSVANALGIENVVIDIKPIVDCFLEDKDDKLVKGNVMARVRMILLYKYANTLDGLVIGTTNKTEAKIGYYTKYGDGAVDVEPIANLYKTEVWEVGRRLPNFPQNIVDKKPSAELWDKQTDEDEMGITYKALDAIFIDCDAVATHKLPVEDFIAKHGSSNIDHVLSLTTKSEHKRHMPPSFVI